MEKVLKYEADITENVTEIKKYLGKWTHPTSKSPTDSSESGDLLLTREGLISNGDKIFSYAGRRINKKFYNENKSLSL